MPEFPISLKDSTTHPEILQSSFTLSPSSLSISKGSPGPTNFASYLSLFSIFRHRFPSCLTELVPELTSWDASLCRPGLLPTLRKEPSIMQIMSLLCLPSFSASHCLHCGQEAVCSSSVSYPIVLQGTWKVLAQ